MKNATFFATALLMFSGPAFSEVKDLGDVSQSAIKGTEVAVPARPAPVSPVIPPGVTIANYSTDEVFSFESQAKPAMDARITVLKAAGITTLGGRVVPAGNDYSFVIDYIPTVKSGASLPPAVTIETYNNGETYWRSADAQAASGPQS